MPIAKYDIWGGFVYIQNKKKREWSKWVNNKVNVVSTFYFDSKYVPVLLQEYKSDCNAYPGLHLHLCLDLIASQVCAQTPQVSHGCEALHVT